MLKQTRNKPVNFLGADKPIGSITPADAIDYRRAQRDNDSEAYVSKQIQLSRQFFRDAVDRKILDENPFLKVSRGSQRSPSRQRFVSRELVDRAIEKAPDIDWKLIIAFARYGGLCIPSEIYTLRWSHIRWNEGRITIVASKTEHHVGREECEIPMFPELEPLLREAQAIALPDEEFVIPRCRAAEINLRTRFLDILNAAGIEPWPKLFQNLRGTVKRN